MFLGLLRWMVDREVDWPVRVVLSRSWGLCVRSWAALGAYVGGLGAVLGDLGPLLGLYGRSLAALGASIGGLGCTWAAVGPMLTIQRAPMRTPWHKYEMGLVCTCVYLVCRVGSQYIH